MAPFSFAEENLATVRGVLTDLGLEWSETDSSIFRIRNLARQRFATQLTLMVQPHFICVVHRSPLLVSQEVLPKILIAFEKINESLGFGNFELSDNQICSRAGVASDEQIPPAILKATIMAVIFNSDRLVPRLEQVIDGKLDPSEIESDIDTAEEESDDESSSVLSPS